MKKTDKLMSAVSNVVPDDLKKLARKRETERKKLLSDLGVDVPEADVGTYSILRWEGEDNTAPYEDLELAEHQTDLPDKIYFRDNNGGNNGRFDFALHSGVIYIRAHDTEDAWRVMPMPDDLKGKVERISVDAHGLIAVDSSNWVYKAQRLLNDTTEWYWRTSCGGLMDIDPWYKLATSEPGQWALSCSNPNYDVYYTDADRNELKFGGSGCTNIYYINPEDNTEIIYNDPWLPSDASRAISSPMHGTVKLSSMSASASTLFVTNAQGDLFTRQYNFDLSGGDEVFFEYTWATTVPGKEPPERPTLLPSKRNHAKLITLPSEHWTRQPKIDGMITDRISIASLGGGSDNRLLRVEGMKEGRTGFFEKNLLEGVQIQTSALGEAGKPAENGSDAWHFVETGLPLQGTPLQNSLEDTSLKNLKEETGIQFAGTLFNGTLQVTDFNYAASYQHGTLAVDGVTVPVKLYMEYGNLGIPGTMVVLPHTRGFTVEPRLYTAALYLYEDSWSALGQTEGGREFQSEWMQGDRVCAVSLIASTERLILRCNSQLQRPLLKDTYELERVK